jgi:nucleoside-diphosphate-sugar epimerase
MDVLVAGGHGQIALRLLKLLAGRGHTARGLIRNPDQVGDLEAVGAHPVLCDLETDDVRPHIGGADAIVFAAGAGAGSGPERKQTVDLGGAVKCIEAARELGVARFLIVSALGVNRPGGWSEAMRPYYAAKAAADEATAASGLDWTIVRPGGLTDAPGTGAVDVSPVGSGQVARDDVALVLYHCLLADNTIRVAFDLVSGPVPVEVAIRQLGTA